MADKIDELISSIDEEVVEEYGTSPEVEDAAEATTPEEAHDEAHVGAHDGEVPETDSVDTEVDEQQSPLGSDVREMALRAGMSEADLEYFPTPEAVRAAIALADRRISQQYQPQAEKPEEQAAESESPQELVDLSKLEPDDPVLPVLQQANERWMAQQKELSQLKQFAQQSMLQQQSQQQQFIEQRINEFDSALDTFESELVGKSGQLNSVQHQARARMWDMVSMLDDGKTPVAELAQRVVRAFEPNVTSPTPPQKSDSIVKRSKQRIGGGGVPAKEPVTSNERIAALARQIDEDLYGSD